MTLIHPFLMIFPSVSLHYKVALYREIQIFLWSTTVSTISSTFLQVADHSCLPKGIKFPLPPPPSPVKGKFCFQKPVSVKVVGSYLLGTGTKPDLNVDIAVEMPKVRTYYVRETFYCNSFFGSSLYQSPTLCMPVPYKNNVNLASYKWLATCRFFLQVHSKVPSDSLLSF